jgi:rhamnosyltransferase
LNFKVKICQVGGRLPKISLIIRTRNEAAGIQQALNGVFAQIVRPDEVILVDSGSTDDTLDKVSGYALKIISIPYERFTFGFAYNEGARSAQGDYLVSLSAHAMPANPLWLKNLLEPLMDDPKRVGSASRQIPFPGQSLEPYLRLWQALFGWGLQTPLVERYLFSNASSAIRAQSWRETPFDETAPTCEDHQWALKMQHCGYRIAYAAESVVYHSHQMTATAAARRRYGELKALIGLYITHPERPRFR